MASKRKWRSNDNICSNCLQSVENLSRLEQDAHEVECVKQAKLF